MLLPALALCMGAAYAVPALSQPLSLDESIAIAAARSSRLEAQRLSISAASEQIGRAGELPDPRLKLGIENLPVSGPNQFRYDRDFMTMRSIGWMQDFPNEDKRAARSLRAERLRDVELAGLVAQDAVIRRDAALAWLEVHYAERVRVAIARLASQFRLQIGAVAAGVASGRQQAVETFALRQAQEQVNDRLIEAERMVARSRIALALWLGDGASRPLGAAPDTSTLIHPRESLLRRIAEHPQLRVFDEREGLARSEVELARASRNADWSVEFGYAQRKPAFDNMISVMAVFELPFARERRQDRDVASRLADAQRVRAEREEARRMHEAEIAGLLADFDSAVRRIERARSVLLPLAATRREAALAAYRGARGELGPVLEAERSATEAEISLANAEADRGRAWASLNFLYSHLERK